MLYDPPKIITKNVTQEMFSIYYFLLVLNLYTSNKVYITHKKKINLTEPHYI